MIKILIIKIFHLKFINYIIINQFDLIYYFYFFIFIQKLKVWLLATRQAINNLFLHIY